MQTQYPNLQLPPQLCTEDMKVNKLRTKFFIRAQYTTAGIRRRDLVGYRIS